MTSPGRLRRYLTGSGAALLAVSGMAGLAGSPASASPHAAAAQHRQAVAHRYGTTNLRSLMKKGAASRAPRSSAGRASANNDARAFPAQEPAVKAEGDASSGPSVKHTQVGSATGVTSFDGIDGADSRLTSDGNQFTSEPSDGALCAAGGGALEVLNSALQFYTPGTATTPVVSLNSFFALPPEIDRSSATPAFPGPSLGDPRCLYDAATGRMMVVAWGTGQDPATGDFTGDNVDYFAVAATSDPLGSYNLYSTEVDAPGDTGCPCQSDHPTLAADKNTVVTTYNRILADGSFDGARVVVLSKKDMEAGATTPVVTLSPGSLGGGLLYTLQGASPTPGAPYSSVRGGTMWFLSALQFQPGVPDNRVALEALSHTGLIDSHPTQLSLTKAVVPGVLSYNNPSPLRQKKGPVPLGASVEEPENFLDGGSDETQSTTLAGGDLWTVIDTALGSKGKSTGLLWMRVTPGTASSGRIVGSVASQGYVAAAGANLDYGDIAVTADTRSQQIVGSLVGPHTYPSAVTASIRNGHAGTLKEYGVGDRPEDGFTCYQAFAGPDAAARGCRWGDYSEITVGDDGNFWMETEYTTPRTRVAFANWGSRIGVTPTR